MSYDVGLVIDTGGDEPVALNDGHNYTYNCGPMFRLALGEDGINSLHGKSAGEMIERLDAAVAHIRDQNNIALYSALEPANKWGNRTGAAEFLADILFDCRCHPRATIRVS